MSDIFTLCLLGLMGSAGAGQCFGVASDDWRRQLLETVIFMALVQTEAMFLRRIKPSREWRKVRSRSELRNDIIGPLFGCSVTFVYSWYGALQNIFGWHTGIGGAVCLALAAAIPLVMDACLLPSLLKWAESQQRQSDALQTSETSCESSNHVTV